MWKDIGIRKGRVRRLLGGPRMIDVLGVITIDCPTLAESAITFHGAVGYLGLLFFSGLLSFFIIREIIKQHKGFAPQEVSE